MNTDTPWCFGGRCTIKVAAVQIVLGLACFCAGIAGCAWHAWYWDIGYGIWSGLLFVATGSAGIQAAKDWKKLWILCFLVTSAGSAAVAVCALLPLSYMAIEVDKLEPDPKKLAVDGILLTAAVLQGLLSGATFLMAFCGCCTAKGRKRRHRPAVGVLTVGYPQQQLAIVPSPHPTPAHNGTFT